jgi:FkbM family methyltransferase
VGDLPKHFLNLLERGSQIRYLLWRLAGGPNLIGVRLKSGLHLNIRSLSSTDYGVAWDIFWRGCYQSPERLEPVSSIVDLGANVGYSCLFWCQQYPQARVTAFEPHPRHLEAIAAHLTANRFSERVKVVPAAAGNTAQQKYLVDAGSSSKVSERADGLPIQVVDLFQAVAPPIDILKIDIEGGEYQVLVDPRFPSLGARTVVVEWHRSADHPEGKQWCEERLRACGYRTQTGVEDLPLAGLLWGFRT